MAAKRSLVEPTLPSDVVIAHRAPLLSLKAQHTGNLLDAFFPFQS
jgi:hypothetical protein